MTSATPCHICGRTLNGALCCPDCGTPVEPPPSAAGPGPGPLPPEASTDRTAGAHPAPPAAEPPQPEPRPAGPPEWPARPGRRGLVAKGTAAVALIAALAFGGFLAFSPAEERPEGAPGPRHTERSRTEQPGSPAATLPSGTPTPRLAGSDPRSPSPTQEAEPSPPPPAPTPRAETPAPPEPAPTTVRPSFSWPSTWPTPSTCEDTPWC